MGFNMNGKRRLLLRRNLAWAKVRRFVDIGNAQIEQRSRLVGPKATINRAGTGPLNFMNKPDCISTTSKPPTTYRCWDRESDIVTRRHPLIELTQTEWIRAKCGGL